MAPQEANLRPSETGCLGARALGNYTNHYCNLRLQFTLYMAKNNDRPTDRRRRASRPCHAPVSRFTGWSTQSGRVGLKMWELTFLNERGRLAKELELTDTARWVNQKMTLCHAVSRSCHDASRWGPVVVGSNPGSAILLSASRSCGASVDGFCPPLPDEAENIAIDVCKCAESIGEGIRARGYC